MIGADPTLKLGEMAIPVEVSKILTIPEKVTQYNIEYLSKLVNEKKAEFIVKEDGDKIKQINVEYATYKKGTKVMYNDTVIRKTENGETKYDIKDTKFILQPGDKLVRNGKEVENLEYPEKKVLTLDIGDTVVRYLRNGDTVLLNRQPTLHSGSMMAMRVVVKPFKSFRFNLACTKSFNADFDFLWSKTGTVKSMKVPSECRIRCLRETLVREYLEVLITTYF